MDTPLYMSNRKLGFTLVEMLVYIAILTIVSGGALTLLFSMTDQINAGRAERALAQSAQNALERMLTDIRAADLAEMTGSTLESSPGVLELTKLASSTVFSISGGSVMLSTDGNSLGALTQDQVTVDSLYFYRYDNSNTELVRIVMTLTATAGDTTITKTFNAAATLRGSYD